LGIRRLTCGAAHPSRMEFAEYKDYLREIRNKYGAYLTWEKHHCRPHLDALYREVIGWSLRWVGTFVDLQFVRLKETWNCSKVPPRTLFSYHYGPYREEWDLLTVRANAVIARIDPPDGHHGGFHVHDNDPDRRIYQSDLESPDLALIDMTAFLDSVLEIRRGRSVQEAFGLKFKK
jgi:hypothetical protein